MKLGELAQKLGAKLVGNSDIEIYAVAPLNEAKEGEIAFLADEKHLNSLDAIHASAIIVPDNFQDIGIAMLKVKNPRLAFAQTLAVFHEKPFAASGISDRAAIGKDCVIGADPSIHPFAVVSDGVRIGNRVTLFPGVYIGPGASIGNDCVLHANVSIREKVRIGDRVIIHAGAVIGSDGFGFVTDSGKHHKIPQVGGVIIEDDVEIGANTTIDRATLGNTVIRKGTKIDNLVQIAHNVTIGEHCLLASQVGIAGSSELGRYVVMGGQVGVGDHKIIGDQVMVGGGSKITQNIPAGQVIAGYYTMPIREWLKVQAVLPKLPELKKSVADIDRKLKLLEEQSAQEHKSSASSSEGDKK